VERGARVELIRRLSARLADESWTDLRLMLQQFELPTAHETNWSGYYEFATLILGDASDNQLVELGRYLFPDEPPAASPPPTDHPWDVGKFRLFVSHTSANRRRVGALRAVFDAWGVDAFVAHDTIEPTREWEDVIRAALGTCDALCALISTDFVQSRWCDQEVGFALARGILVVPLRYGADPHGFIGRYQALPVPSPSTPAAVAEGVFGTLARNRLTAASMTPAVVLRFERAETSEEVRAMFELLRGMPSEAWTPALMDQVERAGQMNDVVRGAGLPGNRLVVEAASEMLQALRGTPPLGAVPLQRADDDIPF
jgi:hypothetical protein